MKTIKQMLITIAVLLCSATANAHDFEVDGIYYNIISASDLTAAVTYKGNSYDEISNEYSGEVIIPETVVYKSKVLKVTSIAHRAFRDCNELTSIEIPNSVAFIGFYAFKGCNSLTSVNIKDIAAWCKIDIDYESGVGGHYESNPLYYANNLYLNGEKVTELVIPNSVTCIRGATFYGCTSLTSVTFGNNLTRIEQAAFSDCSGLTSIEIPNTMSNIEESTFSYCSGLTSVMIPNNITSIGDYAFSGCSALTCLEIPNSVTSIGVAAFKYCSGLTSVTIGNSVTSIGKSAFSNCSGLKKAEFNCSEIQDWFSESSIEEIVIGNSVTSIGNYAFYGCTSLKKLRIEDGTETLSLGYISIYNGNTSYRGVFCNCPLETIYLGRNISYDENLMTYGYFSQKNDALTSVTIGNNVTRIRGEEFSRNSNLANIVIGNSVESIGRYAFEYCSGVTNIHLLGKTPPTVGSDNFTQSQYTDITIYVPTGTLETYKTADTWKNFWDIREEDTTETPEEEVKKCATPLITYNNSGLDIASETDGSEIRTTIKCSDVDSFNGSRIDLSATYNITAYATKSGYLNSETATATLCWIAVSGDSEDNSIIKVEAMPVLITCNNSTINICGGKEGAEVVVYTTSGVAVGNAIITNGNATINTGLAKGEIAIVNIAGWGIKVVMQ
ncbi:MAG: leucine-rich repeat protein [Bacteroidaceae bacterium]|nr:leucine-rich repeat protein [Bacteroidaceae bacterium]